jgi:hypothetical protein
MPITLGDTGISGLTGSITLPQTNDNTIVGPVLHNNATSGAIAGLYFQGYDWVQGGIWHGRGVTGTNRSGAVVLGTNPNTADLSKQGLIGRLIIDNDGRVTMPYQPAFSADEDGVGLSAGFASNSKMTFSTVLLNNGNHYSVANARFTAPIAGNYFISAGISPGNATSTNVWVGMHIRKNGSVIGSIALGHVSVVSNNNQYDQISKEMILSLAAGDYIEVTVPYNTFNGNCGFGHFCGYLLG